MQYANKHLKVPLVILLGHENCGAIKTTIDGGTNESCLNFIGNKILPSIYFVKSQYDIHEDFIDRVTIFNKPRAFRT